MDYLSVLFYSVWGTGNQVVVLVVHTRIRKKYFDDIFVLYIL